MKILVAVDGSEFTKRMLAYLTAHDEFPGTGHEYTILHTVAPVPPRAAGVLDKDLVDEYYKDEAEKVFKPIRAFLEKQSMQTHFAYKVGHAGDAIAAYANEGKYDLVVLGSHGHSALTNLVMGSVATKVMAKCSVPMLIVR